MAIHYNLAKIYAIADDDNNFVLQILNCFIQEVPEDLLAIKEGIKNKDYTNTYSYAHKIKPTLDLLGMEFAFEEILQIENWAKKEDRKKEIKEIYKSLSKRIELAIVEIKKNFNV